MRGRRRACRSGPAQPPSGRQAAARRPSARLPPAMSGSTALYMVLTCGRICKKNFKKRNRIHRGGRAQSLHALHAGQKAKLATGEDEGESSSVPPAPRQRLLGALRVGSPTLVVNPLLWVSDKAGHAYSAPHAGMVSRARESRETAAVPGAAVLTQRWLGSGTPNSAPGPLRWRRPACSGCCRSWRGTCTACW